MQLCEAKEDFSYIYTSDLRDNSSDGRRWRPKAECGLVPILRWHCWGWGQPGNVNEQSLELYDMIELDTSTEPDQQTVDEVTQWLFKFSSTHRANAPNLEGIRLSVPRALQDIGWKGCETYRSCSIGLILFQETLPPDVHFQAFASSTVRWAFGAPGIAQISRDGEVMGYSALVVISLHVHSIPKTNIVLEH